MRSLDNKVRPDDTVVVTDDFMYFGYRSRVVTTKELEGKTLVTLENGITLPSEKMHKIKPFERAWEKVCK